MRLGGCNAAEHKPLGGPYIREHFTALLPAGTQLILHTIKDYKYAGEFIAWVFLA